MKSAHVNRISDDDVDKLGGMVLNEFFCTVCDFVTDNKENLNGHNDSYHKSVQGPLTPLRLLRNCYLRRLKHLQ